MDANSKERINKRVRRNKKNASIDKMLALDKTSKVFKSLRQSSLIWSFFFLKKKALLGFNYLIHN